MLTGNSIIDSDLMEILKEKFEWNFLAKKTILITGANGFIPSYIVYVLLALNKFLGSNIKILALARNREKAELKFSKFLNDKNFKLVISDVSSSFAIDEHIDIIIHAASQASPKYYGVDPVGTLKANVLGTVNCLELAVKNKVKKFLYISSGEVYGVLDGTIKSIPETYTGNVDVTSVRSCYAESKRMGETMCVCYAHQYNFQVNMLRLSHTYGPGVQLDDGRVFADFVKNILNEENILLNSDGKAKRSFVYISDMIIALFTVLFKAENTQAFNVSSEVETEILELAEMLCGLYPEKKLKVEFSKNISPKGYIRAISVGSSMSIEKIKMLGWRPKIDIKTGFKRMIESYKQSITNVEGEKNEYFGIS